MVITTPLPQSSGDQETPASPDFENAEAMQDLSLPTPAEAQPKRTTKTEYLTEADDIIASFTRASELPDDASQQEAFRKIRQAYVVEAENPDLQLLASVILGSRAAVHNQRMLSSIRQQAQAQQVKVHKLAEPVVERYRTAKEGMILFNHRLRELILHTRGMIPRTQLSTWLNAVNPLDVKIVKSLIVGMAAEVAYWEMAARTPGVVGAYFLPPKQDDAGRDLVVQSATKREYLDIKSSDKPDSNPNSVIIHVPPEHVDNYSIRLDKVPYYQNQIRYLLGIA